MPPDLEVTHEGMVVVGAAIGTDAFIKSHIDSAIGTLIQRLKSVAHLDPQCALLLQSKCLANSVGYSFQVTPPRLAMDAAAAWDEAMDACRNLTLTNPEYGATPFTGTGLQSLADRKAKLPHKLGGLAHTSAVLLAPIAFYSTYCQHACLDKGTRKRLLKAELAFCMERLRATIHFLDQDAHLFSSVDSIGTKMPPRKLQRDLMRCAHTNARHKLIDWAKGNAQPEDVRVLSTPTDAWLTFEAVPTCSSLTLGGAVFIAQSRFYLLLPQLLRLSGTPGIVDDPVHPGADSFSVPTDLSYEADVCRQCPNTVCDRHLIHAHACRKTSKPKIRDRHELVKMVRADMIVEAGFSGVKVEPRTDYDRDQRRADRHPLHRQICPAQTRSLLLG